MEENIRPPFDEEMRSIANYIANTVISSELAYSTARYCLMDALGCAMLALRYPECTKLLGPIIAGTSVPHGVRVPGTKYVLDPILAAFNIGTLIRWLDFNDTWLAQEWGHPSDNLGAILAITDYQSQQRILQNKAPLLMRDVLTAMVKAYEIQGVLALENSFNRLGLDHVILVKIASTALAAYFLDASEENIVKALSQAWLDGQSLRTYRHAPNTGSRKSWAAGDATSRGVRLAWLTQQGEMGYPSALTAKTWGLIDTTLRGNTLKRSRAYAAYVMENILFKVSFPAEFHAQTAVECAITLHPQVRERLSSIIKIEISTQEAAMRIISKTGPLHNPADRDHCLQYMAAVALINGNLTAEHYEDHFAQDPRIDALRAKMQVQENLQFSLDYLNPEKRSISNAMQIFFDDGSSTEKITVEYPIGHKRRREAAILLLIDKFKNNLSAVFDKKHIDDLGEMFMNQKKLEAMTVDAFMRMFVK